MKSLSLITLAIAAAILAGCSSSSEPVSQSGSGNPAPIASQTPKITEADAHVPFYPGATVNNDKSMIVKTDTEESVLVNLSSTDDPKKIADFYQDSVKGVKFNEFKTGEAVNYIGEAKGDDGAKIAIAIMKKTATDPVEITIGYGKEGKKP